MTIFFSFDFFCGKRHIFGPLYEAKVAQMDNFLSALTSFVAKKAYIGPLFEAKSCQNGHVFSKFGGSDKFFFKFSALNYFTTHGIKNLALFQ